MIKRLILSLLLTLCLTGTGWGASLTKTVCASGCDYTSPSSALSDLNSVAPTGTGVGEGHVLKVAAGSYEVSMNVADTDMAGSTISGYSDNTFTAPAKEGDVLFYTATANAVLQLTVSNCTVNDITFKTTTALKHGISLGTGTGVVFNRCVIKESPYAMKSVSGSFTFNRCHIYGNTQTNYIAGLSGSTFIFNYCIFENNQGPLHNYGTNPSLTLNNCLMIGFLREAVTQNSATGTTTINNSIFAANGSSVGDDHVLDNTSGTMSVNNSVLLPNALVPKTYYLGGTIAQSGNKYTSPLFKSPRYGGRLAVIIDDYANWAHFKDIVAIADSYGYKLTMSLDNTATIPSATWDDIADYVAAGHDVAVHTRHHQILTNLTGMSIQYVGSGTEATMTITGNTLATTCTGAAGDNLNIDLTSSGYDTINELVTYINNLPAYTATKTGSDDALSANLADISVGQDIKTAVYATMFDATRLYTDEITNCKNDIDTALSARLGAFSVKTIVYPGNQADETVFDFAASAGLAGGFAVGSSGYKDLSSGVDIFGIYRIAVGSVYTKDSSDTLIRDATATATAWNYFGYVGALYAHGTEEMSPEQWGYIFSALKSEGIGVMTASDLVEWIADNGTDAGGGTETYTYTFADQSDYRLRSGSPARDHGINLCTGENTPLVGCTGAGTGTYTDYAGKAIRGAPDIGAYEYYPVKKAGGVGYFKGGMKTGNAYKSGAY